MRFYKIKFNQIVTLTSLLLTGYAAYFQYHCEALECVTDKGYLASFICKNNLALRLFPLSLFYFLIFVVFAILGALHKMKSGNSVFITTWFLLLFVMSFILSSLFHPTLWGCS